MCTSVIGLSEDKMNLESLLMLIVSVLLLVYLTYAMLRPEKF
jgi:K+-transporting ATPase KdpF subunit